MTAISQANLPIPSIKRSLPSVHGPRDDRPVSGDGVPIERRGSGSRVAARDRVGAVGRHQWRQAEEFQDRRAGPIRVRRTDPQAVLDLKAHAIDRPAADPQAAMRVSAPFLAQILAQGGAGFGQMREATAAAAYADTAARGQEILGPQMSVAYAL